MAIQEHTHTATNGPSRPRARRPKPPATAAAAAVRSGDVGETSPRRVARRAARPTAPAAPDLVEALSWRLTETLATPGLAAHDLAALAPHAERLAAEQARRAFVAALARLQGELPEIPERGEIRDPDGRPLGAYALWEDCAALLRGPLGRHGFALTFRTETGAQSLSVAARLAHVGGHVEETALSLPFDASGWKNPLQAIGSAAAYGKRYAAQALLNLISRGDDDDDDGRAAGGGDALDARSLQALREALAAAGGSEAKLARYLGLASLAALPPARLEEAKAAVAAFGQRRRA